MARVESLCACAIRIEVHERRSGPASTRGIDLSRPVASLAMIELIDGDTLSAEPIARGVRCRVNATQRQPAWTRRQHREQGPDRRHADSSQTFCSFRAFDIIQFLTGSVRSRSRLRRAFVSGSAAHSSRCALNFAKLPTKERTPSAGSRDT